MQTLAMFLVKDIEKYIENDHCSWNEFVTSKITALDLVCSTESVYTAVIIIVRIAHLLFIHIYHLRKVIRIKYML